MIVDASEVHPSIALKYYSLEITVFQHGRLDTIFKGNNTIGKNLYNFAVCSCHRLYYKICHWKLGISGSHL
jgi:hypothetical protein